MMNQQSRNWPSLSTTELNALVDWPLICLLTWYGTRHVFCVDIRRRKMSCMEAGEAKRRKGEEQEQEEEYEIPARHAYSCSYRYECDRWPRKKRGLAKASPPIARHASAVQAPSRLNISTFQLPLWPLRLRSGVVPPFRRARFGEP